MMTRFLALLLLVGPAYGHDWYPSSCCSSIDCRPVACDQLEETAKGGIRDTVTKHEFSPWQVKPSQDSRCHTCINPQNNGAICAFVVNGS